MKDINRFIDKWGFVCHIDRDGNLEAGDGLQRLGTYYTSLYFKYKDDLAWLRILSEELLAKVSQCKLVTGEMVRHPDYTKWYGQDGTCSADQLRGILVALSLYSGVNERITKFKNDLMCQLVSRFFFCWNTKNIGQERATKAPDLFFGADWTICLRSFSYAVLWPVICVLDIFLVFNVMIRVVMGWIDPDDVGDDINLSLMLMLSSHTHNTPIAYVARLLYYWRPGGGPDRATVIPGIGFISAWMWYFAGENNPPLDQLMEPHLRFYLSR